MTVITSFISRIHIRPVIISCWRALCCRVRKQKQTVRQVALEDVYFVCPCESVRGRCSVVNVACVIKTFEFRNIVEK